MVKNSFTGGHCNSETVSTVSGQDCARYGKEHAHGNEAATAAVSAATEKETRTET